MGPCDLRSALHPCSRGLPLSVSVCPTRGVSQLCSRGGGWAGTLAWHPRSRESWMTFVEVHLRAVRWGPSRGEGVAGEGALRGSGVHLLSRQPGRSEHAGGGAGVGGLGRHQEVDTRGPAWLSTDRAAGRQLWGLGFSQPGGLAGGGGWCRPAQGLRHPQRRELVRRRNQTRLKQPLLPVSGPLWGQREGCPSSAGPGDTPAPVPSGPVPKGPLSACPPPSHGSRLGDPGLGPCVALSSLGRLGPGPGSQPRPGVQSIWSPSPSWCTGLGGEQGGLRAVGQ